MRDLPALLRAAERRVNAHVWPNAGADSHLASIPADRDTDTDLLLLEAANRIATLEAALATFLVWNGTDYADDESRESALVGICEEAYALISAPASETKGDQG